MSLTLIVGPTAVGKTTIWKKLILEHNCVPSKTHTTRPPRETEKLEGAIDQYFFVTREAFENLLEEDVLFEHVEYVGNYYGTAKEDIEKAIVSDQNYVSVVEINGALKIKEAYPEVTTIFIKAPSNEEMRRRILSRGSESNEEIQQRLQTAFDEELPQAELMDKIIINDDLERATKETFKLLNIFLF